MPKINRDYMYAKDVTDTIRDIWLVMPELRLGQLLDNAVGRYQNVNPADMFNIGDGELLVALKSMKEDVCGAKSVER